MEARIGGKQSKMVCKENKAEQERETKGEKKWERREGGWKVRKTGAETEGNTEEAGVFLVPCGFLVISFRSPEA